MTPSAQQTIPVTLPNNRTEDFVLVPVKVFRDLEEERLRLEQSLKQQEESLEVLRIIQEGEVEYQTGKTSTAPLSSLLS